MYEVERYVRSKTCKEKNIDFVIYENYLNTKNIVVKINIETFKKISIYNFVTTLSKAQIKLNKKNHLYEINLARCTFCKSHVKVS